MTPEEQIKKLRSELAGRNRENHEMREALIDYYVAETEYELLGSPARYGKYDLASKALIALARRLAEQKQKTKRPAKAKSLFS